MNRDADADWVGHGWRLLRLGDPSASTQAGRSKMWGADLTGAHRCMCSTRRRCAHNATQEDLLCDWCRANCRAVSPVGLRSTANQTGR